MRDPNHKMTDDEIEPFVKHDPEAYKRFKRHKKKKKILKLFNPTKKFLKGVSQVILWICAVGGFVLSLIQFFQDN